MKQPKVEITIEPASRKPFPNQARNGEIMAVEMTRSCARDLTDRIKVAAQDLAEMLHRAHEGRAWEALGYASWKEYCTAEFQMSARHSYRLLDFAQIKSVLSDQLVTPESESQVRPLTQLEPDQQPAAWERAVEIADGEQPTAMQVRTAVNESSAQAVVKEERLPMLDIVVDKLSAEIRGFIDVAGETKRAQKIREILNAQDEMSPESQEKLQRLRSSLDYLGRKCLGLAKEIRSPDAERFQRPVAKRLRQRGVERFRERHSHMATENVKRPPFVDLANLQADGKPVVLFEFQPTNVAPVGVTINQERK